MRTRQKAILAAAVMIASCNVTFAAYVSPAKRAVIVENRSWKFIHQDATGGAQASGYNDAAWSTVGLPHSFDIPYWRAATATSPTVGWYRKHLTIPAALLTTKRFFLEFEAAFLVSQVYVNGTSAGIHKGGYTGFSYDITSLLVAGDNVIAVRVDATWNGQVAPRGGEHHFIGGIYRDVYLVITDPLHVTWYGTFVSTPQATTASATVKVKTEIRNNATSAKSCTVTSIVVDSSGNEVTRFQSTVSVPAGVLDTFVQTGTVANPHLWSPQTPYMYTLYTEVSDGATVVDNFSSPLGMRTIQWSGSNGFSINGQHLWLHGADVHQDHAGWGDATTNSGSFRDVKMIKDCGMNFIRGSHYPHSPAFSDACDKYGICLWSEMCYWAPGGPSTSEPPPNWNASAYPIATADQAPFEANAKLQLQEMIRIHRNHPSVIVWSMGNEVFFSDASVMTQAKNLVSAMVVVAHVADSTRAAGMGGCQRQGFDVLSDVAGYNGDGASLYINPGFPNMVSEYGSCKEDRPGNYDACWGANLQLSGDSTIQYAWRSGVALWCGFHHGSNSGVAYGGMGMIDHARLPLERWYYYRNKNLGIAPPVWPVAGTAAKLLLTKDCDTITDDGQSDCHLTVQVQNAAGAWLTNSPAITFTDASGLGIFPSSNTGSTSINFTSGAIDDGVLNGMAAIEYRSYKAGTATINATSAGLTTSSVTIVVKHVQDSIFIPTGVITTAHFGQPGPESQLFKAAGNRIFLPQNMRYKKINASIYDLQGRLLFSKIINAQNAIDLSGKNFAGEVFLVKVRTLN